MLSCISTHSLDCVHLGSTARVSLSGQTVSGAGGAAFPSRIQPREQGSGAVQKYGMLPWPCRFAPGIRALLGDWGWVFLSFFFLIFFCQIGILFGSILSTKLSSVTLPLLLLR